MIIHMIITITIISHDHKPEEPTNKAYKGRCLAGTP